jgi:hypothetical protein
MHDDRLRQYIRESEQSAEPDSEFGERLFAELGGTARRRTTRWPILLAAAAIGVVTIAGGAVAGGLVGQLANHQSPGPSASAVAVLVETPSESASESASATPSPSPSTTPTLSPTPTPTPSAIPTAQPSAAPPPAYHDWTQLATTPTVPTGIADFIVGRDRRLYAIPWGDDAQQVLVYDPGANTWQLRRPAARRAYDVGTGEAFVAAPDGLFYSFAGGAEGTDVFTYDPSTNRWSTGPIARLPIVYRDAVVGKDGKVYLMEVCCTSGAHLVTFDLTTHMTTEVGRRSWTVLTLVRDDAGMLRMTGNTGVGTYDPASNAWTWQDVSPTAPLRGYLTAGGAEGVYDASNDLVTWKSGGTWMNVPPPPTNQRIQSIVWYSGNLYVLTVDRSLTGNQDGPMQLWAISPSS